MSPLLPPDLTATALRLLQVYGPLALAAFAFLESSMLFPFLPSEVVVPAAAALLVGGVPSFLAFVAAASVGGTAGAFVPFYVFRDTRLGERDWLQRWLHVPEDRLERARTWYRRWGQSSVCWGRFLPGLRSVVSIPAGLADMTSTRFGAYTAAGVTGFYAATAGLVYYGRRRSVFAASVDLAADNPVATALVLLALLGLGVVAGRVLRGRRAGE